MSQWIWLPLVSLMAWHRKSITPLSQPRLIHHVWTSIWTKISGGWFNVKMSFYQYRNSHCGDQTILWPTYLHFGISYTCKTTSCMMTYSNGNIFRVTGPLCGEFTGHRWIPLTKASDTELWCFLWSVPEQTVEQTAETPVIWDAITLIMMLL